MHQRVEHLKMSLEVQMINIIDIKADDVFVRKIFHRRHLKESKLPDLKFLSYKGPNKFETFR